MLYPGSVVPLAMFSFAPSHDSHGAYGGSYGNSVAMLYFHVFLNIIFAWTLDNQTKLATNLYTKYIIYMTMIKTSNREFLAWNVFLSTDGAMEHMVGAEGMIALLGGNSSQDNLGGSRLCSSSGLFHFSIKWYFDLRSYGNISIIICTVKRSTPSGDSKMNY